MSDDNDLIRRGDAALAVLQNFTETAQLEALNSLPAVQVTVKQMEWVWNGACWSATTVIGLYRVSKTLNPRNDRYMVTYLGQSNRSHAVGYFDGIQAAKAAAQADYEARIRSALTVTPAPDAAKVQALVEELRRQSAWVRSALDCPAWQWDEDQREVAESQHADAIAALAAMKEW